MSLSHFYEFPFIYTKKYMLYKNAYNIYLKTCIHCMLLYMQLYKNIYLLVKDLERNSNNDGRNSVNMSEFLVFFF